MLVIIKDKGTITKQVLSSYYQYEGISIYFDEDYYISLNTGYYFEDNTRIKKVELKSYVINREDDYEPIYLYFYDSSGTINDFHLYENTSFLFGNNSPAQIISKDPYLKNIYLRLNNKHLETNYQDLIINKHKYNDSSLRDGDYVELLSFSFYYYDDFLYINDFLSENHLPRKTINEEVPHYKKIKYEIDNYYEEPKKGIKLSKIKNFNVPKRGNSRKLILQIGPTITMSIAMILLAYINITNNYAMRNSKLGMLSLLLMPCTMLISGILWPTLISLSDKGSYKREYNHQKGAYINYLKEYDYELENKLKEFLKEENRDFFKTEDIQNKLFYIANKSKDFLNITIGYQKLALELDINLTQDKEIDEHLNRIKYRVSNIDDCPLYLNLKENKRVTFIVKDKSKEYFFYRFLLELAYKYHYEDIHLAIYAKDKNLIKDLYKLPHLFYGQKRLTLNSERQLRDLNNIKLTKPLVLLMYDESQFFFTNTNIHVIYLSSMHNKILKDADCIVEFNNNSGVLYSKQKIAFKYYEETINFAKHFNYISNSWDNNNNKLVYSFKDFYPNINIVNNYLLNRTTLEANFSTFNNELLSFDLHETKDGPHGLIGGSTGSGKSELIISMLLSLVIRYSPEYLNIILIDYKGGGIKESLSYGKDTIPHIIAAINNLEPDTFERLIVAIARECKKRQQLFKKLANLAMTSIMNIDEYLEKYKEYGLENIAHLLIVVDEFAELKKENPYVIKELISFSRIGRSLGIHLILATQRPSGVIDDEIWSNSHFKIALKVHSEKDSQDIIKSKEAAYLNSPGEFYLKVDDNTIKAKAIYAKRDINNNDEYEVALLDNELDIIKKKTYKEANTYLEATYLSKLILEATNLLNIKTIPFEFEKSQPLSIKELSNKYNSKEKIIMGEIDDYLNAKKGILEYSLNDNLLIYSNRKNEMNNLIYNLEINGIQTIIISNKHYQGTYISDSLLYEDEEDIKYLFKKIINDRNIYLNLIIEDLSSFLSYDEEYLNIIYQLVRRSNVSKYVLTILTKESNINYKLLNSIKNKTAIDIYDYQDVINLFSAKGNYQGKSFFFKDIPITFIPCIIEEYMIKKTDLKPYIDVIPEIIKYEYIKDYLLIGYDVLTRKKIFINDNDTLLISSYNQELLDRFQKLFGNNSNIKIAIYSYELIKEEYSCALWLGEGLHAQRLFYVEKDYSFADDEAYLFKANIGRIIKPVNYE